MRTMRAAFVRSETNNAVLLGSGSQTADQVEGLRNSAKAGSSSKNILMELVRQGRLSDAREWKLWNHQSTSVSTPGLLPISVFEMSQDRLVGLEKEIHDQGPPDILWVEGPHRPAYLKRIFELCESSFKVVYSKDWKPWKIENLAAFDLCLVDEESQAERVHRKTPSLPCGVWDKLIDYETGYFPIDCPKDFDICYVAYFRPRKNHRLLFEAMASLLPERRVSCVLIGGDRENYQAELESLAADLDIDARFAGEVDEHEVNNYVNRSRIGVMLSEKDAAPRVTLEYLAANVPVLINSELRAGARYVNQRSGAVLPPDRLHEGLAQILDNHADYSPRTEYLARFSREKVVSRFAEIPQDAGCSLPPANLPSAG